MAALATVTVNGLDTLCWILASPGYEATIVRDPAGSVVVVTVAWPAAFSGIGPSGAPPATLNVTAPVGIATLGAASVTVAVKVTTPKIGCGATTTVVELTAVTTGCVSVDDVLAFSLASPPYTATIGLLLTAVRSW